MGWPQITWLVIVMLGVGITLEQHGKPKTGKHNIWVTLVALGINVGLLNAGGFFG